MAKLLVYPRELKIPTKTRQSLAEAGYILIAEDELGSVRVVEPLPEFDVASDSAWLVRTLLQLVIADDSYAGTRGKFTARLLKKLEARFAEGVDAPEKTKLIAVEKAS